MNEVEEAGHKMVAMEGRLNLSTGQDVLMATLQSVAAGTVSPEEAILRIQFWLDKG